MTLSLSVHCALIFTSILLSMPAATSAAESPILPLSLAHQTRALLMPWKHDDQPGVSVAIMFKGRIALSEGVGLANLEYKIAITPDTVFNAASLSKQVTAFAIFTLAAEQKLSLDDDIRKFLPSLKRQDVIVTIKNLLEHTGGFREVGTLSTISGQLEDDIKTNSQLFRLIADQTSGNFAPGSQVEYSNTGYFLLASIVENISGQSFSLFTKENIFDPLAMTRTQFHDDRKRLIPNRAYSYEDSYGGFIKLNLNSEMVGSTGMQTTAEDLLKWAENLENQALGQPEIYKMIAARSKAQDLSESTLANGQELRPYKGLQTWSHGGRDAGFRSFLIRIPKHEFAISILSNRADFDTAKLAFKIIDLYFDLEEKPAEGQWPLADRPMLKQYAGEYELYPGTIFSIAIRADVLQFSSFNSGEKSTLKQTGERRFSLNSTADLSIEFVLDEHRRVVAFNYIIGLHGKIKARKLDLLPFSPQDARLNDFIGDFISTELQTLYKISTEENVLVVTPPRLPPIELSAYQDDTFLSAHGNFPKIEFIRDSTNAVIACLVSGPLAQDVVFEKIRLAPPEHQSPRNPSLNSPH